MPGRYRSAAPAAPRVLLVCSQPMLTSSALYCLNGMGAQIVAAGEDYMRFLRWSRFCERFETCDIIDFEPAQLAARLNQLTRRHRIDIVVPADNDGQSRLVQVEDRLEAPVFPMPKAEDLPRLNDKQWFNDRCLEIGVPVPASEFVDDKYSLDPDGHGDRLGYPLIVKPTNWGGSDGVVLARSAEDLRRQTIHNEAYRFHPLVVQEYIPGRDVGFNVFAVQGRPVLTSAQTRFGEEVVYLDNDELIALGNRFVEVAGLTGIANLDARVGPDGRITFFECNARIWASICHAHWCGTNYVAAGVRHVLGLPAGADTALAGRSVSSPARLIYQLARGQRAAWRLSQPERRALAQGAADPVLLLRHYLERRSQRTVA